MRPKHVVYALLIAVVLMALITTIDRAQAHTRGDLELWTEEWIERADDSLSPELVVEYQDMRNRHSWYFDPQPLRPRGEPFGSSWSGNVEQWRPLVARWFAPEKVATAMCILNHETGGTGDPNALNDISSAAGLFQFLRSTWNKVPLSVTGGSYDSGMVLDPVANVKAAAWLERNFNWGQWTVYYLCRGL